MKGQEIKEILKNEGYTMAEIARALGFDNEQRLHSALKSDDVKSGLIEKIAQVTNKSVAFFYPNNGAVASDSSIAVNGNSNEINTISARFIGLLENKDKQINKRDEQIDKLIELIGK